jgi:hypothetical protein
LASFFLKIKAKKEEAKKNPSGQRTALLLKIAAKLTL